jgi:hypothetical protein
MQDVKKLYSFVIFYVNIISYKNKYSIQVAYLIVFI